MIQRTSRFSLGWLRAFPLMILQTEEGGDCPAHTTANFPTLPQASERKKDNVPPHVLEQRHAGKTAGNVLLTTHRGVFIDATALWPDFASFYGAKIQRISKLYRNFVALFEDENEKNINSHSFLHRLPFGLCSGGEFCHARHVAPHYSPQCGIGGREHHCHGQSAWGGSAQSGAAGRHRHTMRGTPVHDLRRRGEMDGRRIRHGLWRKTHRCGIPALYGLWRDGRNGCIRKRHWHLCTKDAVMGAGYSYLLSDHWAGGANFKAAYSRIADYSSASLAVDLGLNYYDAEKALSVSMVMRNIGAQIKTYDGVVERVPYNLQLGLTKGLAHLPVEFHITLTDLTRWKKSDYLTIPDTEKEKQNGDGSTSLSTGRLMLNHLVFGIEVKPRENIWIAAGYNFRRGYELQAAGKGHLAGLSAGAGIRLQRFSIGLAWAKYHMAAQSLMGNVAVSF